jgi:hypothetical protein
LPPLPARTTRRSASENTDMHRSILIPVLLGFGALSAMATWRAATRT